MWWLSRPRHGRVSPLVVGLGRRTGTASPGPATPSASAPGPAGRSSRSPWCSADPVRSGSGCPAASSGSLRRRRNQPTTTTTATTMTMTTTRPPVVVTRRRGRRDGPGRDRCGHRAGPRSSRPVERRSNSASAASSPSSLLERPASSASFDALAEPIFGPAVGAGLGLMGVFTVGHVPPGPGRHGADVPPTRARTAGGHHDVGTRTRPSDRCAPFGWPVLHRGHTTTTRVNTRPTRAAAGSACRRRGRSL
jgi:hypothetical protein